MKIEPSFYRSTVGRRIFVLFICRALIPIGALTILSFYRVTAQLEEQSQRRLHQAARAVGVSIYERLKFLEAEMRAVAATFGERPVASVSPTLGVATDPLSTLFKGMALIGPGDKFVPLRGHTVRPPSLTAAERQHLSSGRVLLSCQSSLQGLQHLSMLLALNPRDEEGILLLGEIDPHYLWGLKEEGILPAGTEFSVLDHFDNMLFSSFPEVPHFSKEELARIKFF